VYGRLGAEGEAWLRAVNFVGKTFDRHVAGFVRKPDGPDGSPPVERPFRFWDFEE
jgi:hypothetical protein